MPGSTPPTSQLDWLSSTTAMIVLLWSRATRDLLKSFGWGIAALHRLDCSDEVAISRRPPHSIFWFRARDYPFRASVRHGSGRREARTSPWVSQGFSMKLESVNKRATSNLSDRRVSGRCLCGAVELEIDFPAFWAWHDHSAASRRAHGAAYATYIGCWRK